MSDKSITAEGIVDEQANDPGLWFVAQTAPEAYLQVALRRLHAAVEDVARIEAIEAERDAALRDAERYRKLRAAIVNSEFQMPNWCSDAIDTACNTSEFDAAIDAALAEKGKP